MPKRVKHLEVRDYLLAEFVNRDSGSHMLPTEIQLAERFGVSRMTVRQALNSLRDEGVLRAVRGVGTFIVRPRLSKGLTLTSFSDDLRARGYEPSSQVLSAEETTANTHLAMELGIRPGAQVSRIERLRLADGNPICLEDVFLPLARFPGLIGHDLSGSLHEVIETAYGAEIRRAEQRVGAINVTGRTAELLGVEEGLACIHVKRITMDSQGRIVSSGQSICRGDVYDFHYIISR
jgi:GntR family transcriptional regulator